jgi:hypothetical protein
MRFSTCHPSISSRVEVMNSSGEVGITYRIV